jgi:hypothetical protein
MGAEILAAGKLRAGGWRGACFCLAQTCERQCAERCETACDETGATQEAAAVETRLVLKTRLVLQCGSKRTTADVTFRSFDQHGRRLTWPDSG